MKNINNHAQSLIVYALIISLTAAVIMSMRVYVTRMVQAKFRQSADVFGQGEQYAKGLTVVTNLDGDTRADIQPTTIGVISIAGQNFIIGRVDSLEEQVDNLTKTADSLELDITQLDAQIAALNTQNMGQQAGALMKNKDMLMVRLAIVSKLIEEKQQEIGWFKKKYPDYFKGERKKDVLSRQRRNDNRH